MQVLSYLIFSLYCAKLFDS